MRDLPILFLRVEGAVLAVLAVFFFARAGVSWLLFALLLLVPDVSMLGYVAGSRVGAISYNLGHTTLLPAALAITGVVAESTITVGVALIWFTHIGMDRMLGYGLKRTTRFRDTHLGPIGRRPSG